MSDFTSMLCLLMMGVALPLMVVVWIVRRGTHQLSSAEAYKEVAHSLGLKLDTRGIGLQGFHANRHLWVGQVLLGPDRRTEVQGVLGFRQPLGYGLTFRSKRKKGIDSGLSTGDEDFDKLFSSNAVHIDVARELLNESVRTAAIELHALCPFVDVSDELIRIKLSTAERTAARLSSIVACMEALADALETQRELVGPAQELSEVIAEWRAHGEQSGWGFDGQFPTLSQTGQWGTISVTPRWMNSEYVAEIRVHFSTVKDTGFRITPQRGPTAPWLTGQDIQVRDPSFDKAFVIKGYHPGNVRRRLHAEARTLLLDLLKSGAFEITDHWIRLPSAPIEVKALDRVLKQTIRVAETLTLA